jgi:hypothetical protein
MAADRCYSTQLGWLRWSFLKISERKTPEVAHCVVRCREGTRGGRRKDSERELGICSHCCTASYLLAGRSIGRPKWGIEILFNGERVMVRGTLPGAVDQHQSGMGFRERGGLSIREGTQARRRTAAESTPAGFDC